MVELIDITKKFSNDVTAVDNISIKFEAGKFYAVMGPSGSGKSTILNMIAGIENPSSGNIIVNDIDILKLNRNQKADYRMNNIGFIFQAFYLNPYLNALNNVMIPMEINKNIKKSDRLARANELLNTVGLEERKKHYPSQMSGGEQQRTAIARALANCEGNMKGSFVILADEPTGNLDEDNERLIFEMLKKMASEGKTVITVSHNDTIKEYADEIIHIVKGKMKND